MDRVPGRANPVTRRSGSRPAERAGRVSAPVAAPRRVAVLPFVNLTGPPVIDTLGLGVAYRIYEALSLRERVIVVAYAGPLAAGEDVYLPEVGRFLRVDALLLGQVRKTGRGLCATASLLDAASGAPLWVGNYEEVTWDTDLAACIADAVTQGLETPPVAGA